MPPKATTLTGFTDLIIKSEKDGSEVTLPIKELSCTAGTTEVHGHDGTTLTTFNNTPTFTATIDASVSKEAFDCIAPSCDATSIESHGDLVYVSDKPWGRLWRKMGDTSTSTYINYQQSNENLKKGMEKLISTIIDLGIDPFEQLMENEDEEDKLAERLKKYGNINDALLHYYMEVK